MIRLFLPPGGAVGDPAVLVRGERFHYLVHVLRLREGDALEVFDGRGTSRPAEVVRLQEDRAELCLGAARVAPRSREITLVQGLPKGDKLELILQKGTELDASRFLPVTTERSIVRQVPARAEAKRERWTRIVEEAARQCGRSDVPEVAAVTTLQEAISGLRGATGVLVLDEEEHALPLSQARAVLERETPLVLVVGPEGGLTREEVRELVALGGQPVTLGRLILRTETASLAALAVLRHLEGSLG